MRGSLFALILVLVADCMVAGCTLRPERPRAPQIVAAASGATVPFEAMIDALEEARVVYVGESHDRPEDHALQLAILTALHMRDPRIALGFEMFQTPYQAPLDAFVADAIAEAELLERTEWQARWGFDFAMYRPLLEFGPEHRVPLVALNAPRELTRSIARGGLEALEEEARADLPELALDVSTHRERVMAVFREHPRMSEARRERFYTAQVVWDETMARSIARFLEEHSEVHRMIVFAGTMHVVADAIPERAARRGASPFAIVTPVDEDEEPPGRVDFVVTHH